MRAFERNRERQSLCVNVTCKRIRYSDRTPTANVGQFSQSQQREYFEAQTSFEIRKCEIQHALTRSMNPSISPVARCTRCDTNLNENRVQTRGSCTFPAWHKRTLGSACGTWRRTNGSQRRSHRSAAATQAKQCGSNPQAAEQRYIMSRPTDASNAIHLWNREGWQRGSQIR